MARGHHGDGFPIGGGLHELRHGEKQRQLIQKSKLMLLRYLITLLQHTQIPAGHNK